MQPLSLVTALAISVLLGAAPSYAAEEQATQKMTKADCSAQAQAHSLIGDIHDSFMKTCMNPKYQSVASQEMMKKCYTQASAQDFKGDALHQFIDTCMKQ